MDFDDRSGIISCNTSWGRWWQTLEDVTVEVHLIESLRAKDIQCLIKPREMKVAVLGKVILEGELYDAVQADDSVWTLEDGQLLRICMTKANRTASNCWHSLLAGQYEADLYVRDQMQQKLTLQRFQLENPGMDFSGATLTGNYQNGGPDLLS